MDIEVNADNDALEEWEYLLLGLRGPNTQPSWLNVEPIKALRRHSGTRRYGVTDKQSRRDNASHAPGRSDYDREGNREVRQPKIAAARSADHDQELNHQHREELDREYPGINTWWVEEVLAILKSRVRAHLYSNKYFCGLTLDEIFLLERLGSSLEQIKAEIEEEEVDRTTTQEPLANWERELLEVGTSTIIDHLSEPFWGRFDMDEDLSYFEDLMCPEHMKPRQVDPELPGAWMSSIHAQDEGGLLAEAFGGWGYKITNRP
ncbi:MAG: hypothetical protein WBP22_03725 [Candidatus Saccharimonas sp.]